MEPYAPSWSWASVTGPVTYYGPYVTQFEQRHQGYQDSQVDVRVSELDPEANDDPVTIFDVDVRPSTLNIYGGPGYASIKLTGHILPVMYDLDQELWESPIITMAHFDPKGLEFRYDDSSQISRILAAGSSTTAFVLLFMRVITSPEFGYIVGTQVVCLLLQRVEGHNTIPNGEGLLRKRGTMKPGDLQRRGLIVCLCTGSSASLMYVLECQTGRC
jgi:hypothetical protein